MFHIVPQKPHHADLIETLLDRAFGPDRHSKRSYAFRDGASDVTDLRFVALAGRKLVGTIRFWPVSIAAKRGAAGSTPALLLGPLGVAPDHQGEGIGAALIHHGLDKAREHGHAICILVGDLTYYGRFGFAPAAIHGIAMAGENPERVLIRELRNDALAGVAGDVRKADGNAVRAA